MEYFQAVVTRIIQYFLVDHIYPLTESGPYFVKILVSNLVDTTSVFVSIKSVQNGAFQQLEPYKILYHF